MGLRIGEVCALQWKDIDLEKRTLTVSKTIQRVQSRTGVKHTKLIITEPKSESSKRTIPIPDCLLPLLRQFKDNGEVYVVHGTSKPVRGNHTELTDLIYNLIDNAINYNRENGNIDITIEDNRFIIADTGIGMPKESIPRIFERFYRVDKSRSRAKGGTGLGLSIVKHIADRHGAQIDVESTMGVGTTISVNFR
jgi:signal transduction histidine kinase